MKSSRKSTPRFDSYPSRSPRFPIPPPAAVVFGENEGSSHEESIMVWECTVCMEAFARELTRHLSRGLFHTEGSRSKVGARSSKCGVVEAFVLRGMMLQHQIYFECD
jgi:hypothetical protein